MKEHSQIKDMLFMDIGYELNQRDRRAVPANGKFWLKIKNSMFNFKTWNSFWMTVKDQVQEFRGMDYENE